MKAIRFYTLLLVLLQLYNYTHGQYSISGYIDTPDKNKTIYLSLLQFDEQFAISKNQVLVSTTADSTGYFSFTGKLLPNKHQLYRIHANVRGNSLGLDLAYTDEIQNMHNFIFSNSDTIVFEKSGVMWFAKSKNTNPIDREWREVSQYRNELREEFSGMKNKEIKAQSTSKFLSVLKSYLKTTETDPLIQLLLINNIPKNTLTKDFESDADYYFGLRDQLENYYSTSSYTLQLERLIADLSKNITHRQLIFYKKTTYALSILVAVLLVGILVLAINMKRKKEVVKDEPIKLTKQEEKIAQLVAQDKTNKEIAAELFISLSTVKTHIRNLYAKLEVSNREQFTSKIKNQLGD